MTWECLLEKMEIKMKKSTSLKKVCTQGIFKGFFTGGENCQQAFLQYEVAKKHSLVLIQPNSMIASILGIISGIYDIVLKKKFLFVTVISDFLRIHLN